MTDQKKDAEIFSEEQLAEMVQVNEGNESEFLNSMNKDEDDVSDEPEEQQQQGNEQQQQQQQQSSEQQQQQQSPNTGGAKPKEDEGFPIDLSMIPGRVMLDMMDGAIRRVEDFAELTFKVRNKPGLGLQDQQKEMLTSIADACMKDAKIRFKTPWHALGTGMFMIIATNAIFGRWEKTEGEAKNEFKARRSPLRKKHEVKVGEPTKQRKPGSGRPKGSKNKPK